MAAVISTNVSVMVVVIVWSVVGIIAVVIVTIITTSFILCIRWWRGNMAGVMWGIPSTSNSRGRWCLYKTSTYVSDSADSYVNCVTRNFFLRNPLCCLH